jgi:hypothetical protein
VRLGGQAWWYTPVIPALRRWRQEDKKFETSLDYVARPCLKNTRQKKCEWDESVGELSLQILPGFCRRAL